MNTLFAKLSVTLLIIVGLMGAALFVVDRINTRVYYEELSQKLNAPIAMYVTGQRQLINNGIPDLDSLRDLASHAMVINPTAEIYLLDTAGKILGHGLPPETVLRDSVDLVPIRALIDASDRMPIRGDDPRSNTYLLDTAGKILGHGLPPETVLRDSVDLVPIRALIDASDRMPIRGDDPRSNSSRKIFSASEVTSENGVEGYLYVILGGQAYEALANDIGDSYAGKASAMAILVIIVLTATIGLLVFGLLTRRLKRLSHEMRRASESGFELDPVFEASSGGGDEIDALTDAYVEMSARIKEQIEQLRENDRLRRELVSNISHDLRTPLSAMQG